MKTPGLVIHEPIASIDLVDPLAVCNLDELAEKGNSLQDKSFRKVRTFRGKDESNGWD